ncbi:glutamyl-tRNA amidotransferase subunit A [Mycolicibacterium litorale]|uniref:Glutamyl-tRNA amidotransferase subunit A n=1 Tax=Mycolicibacterium litorale TaxID=758802 RepID=A0A6S6P1B2_9MYCO|nr:amidase [Mycolicibacterium litorale]BCI52269.1 glutamyl-tRNA amidotransferase subunit A [Mycolicibacterium litorale]
MQASTHSHASADIVLSPTLTALAGGVRTATHCVDAAIARIGAVDGEVHAWVAVDEDGARAQARLLDALPAERRGPLHGLPVGVKDIVDVRGFPTRCGSAATSTEVVSSDATVVQMLRDAGAVILGKTVTTEFAYFSPGPTANPHRLGHTPGGSSSGSAAAVAAGMAPLAIGTQTAASVTRPAAYCGVHAIVLPRGLVATDGIAGLAESLDSPGLLGSDALGLAAVLDAVLPNGGAVPVSEVLVWRPGPSFGVHTHMLAAVDRIGDHARELGLAVADIDLDAQALALVDAHRRIMAYEAARQSRAATMPRGELSPTLRQLLDDGAALDRVDYERASAYVQTVRREFLDRLRSTNAAILAPAAQGAAPEGLSATGDPVMSRPWQALGLAAATFPVGFCAGLPLGLQLVGADDGRALLRLADTLCRRT